MFSSFIGFSSDIEDSFELDLLGNIPSDNKVDGIGITIINLKITFSY